MLLLGVFPVEVQQLALLDSSKVRKLVQRHLLSESFGGQLEKKILRIETLLESRDNRDIRCVNGLDVFLDLHMNLLTFFPISMLDHSRLHKLVQSLDQQVGEISKPLLHPHFQYLNHFLLDREDPRLLPLLVREIRELPTRDRVPLQQLCKKFIGIGERRKGGDESRSELGVLDGWVGQVNDQLVKSPSRDSHGDVDIHNNINSLGFRFVPDVESMGSFDFRVFDLDEELEEFDKSSGEFFGDRNIFDVIWFRFWSTGEKGQFCRFPSSFFSFLFFFFFFFLFFSFKYVLFFLQT